MLEGNLEEKKKSEELFLSDDENRSNSIVDDRISKLDIKDALVAKSMEAYQLDNSDKQEQMLFISQQCLFQIQVK